MTAGQATGGKLRSRDLAARFDLLEEICAELDLQPDDRLEYRLEPASE